MLSRIKALPGYKALSDLFQWGAKKELNSDLAEDKDLIKSVHEKLQWEIFKNKEDGPIEDSIKGFYGLLNDKQTIEYYKKIGDKIEQYPDDLKAPELLFGVTRSIYYKLMEEEEPKYVGHFMKALGHSPIVHKFIGSLSQNQKGVLLTELGKLASLLKDDDAKVKAFQTLNQNGFLNSLVEDAHPAFATSCLTSFFANVDRIEIEETIKGTPFMGTMFANTFDKISLD